MSNNMIVCNKYFFYSYCQSENYIIVVILLKINTYLDKEILH